MHNSLHNPRTTVGCVVNTIDELKYDKGMFCPKCGAEAQTAESYCKRCGEWLPDIDHLTRPRVFRKRTREEKIRKMRVLEAVSAGLSLTAASIIITVLAGGADTQLLFLAAICCFLIAAYQVINFYLGYKLQHRIDQTRAKGTREIIGESTNRVRGLSAGDASSFVGGSSVTEDTTELLEPLPREAKRGRRNRIP